MVLKWISVFAKLIMHLRNMATGDMWEKKALFYEVALTRLLK